MSENDSHRLPSFASLDELVEFFDTNDLGEYERDLSEVHLNVELKRKTHLVAIDEETNKASGCHLRSKANDNKDLKHELTPPSSRRR